MSDSTAVAVQQPAQESLVSILSRMSTNPNFNAESFSVLIAAAERERLDQRKAEFATALHAIQSMRLRVFKRKQGKNNKYAPLEDVDELLAPHLAKYGLTNSFDVPAGVDERGIMNIVVHISHLNGYGEPRSIPMPIDDIGKNKDGKPLRPACQDHGSTFSYGRRHLLKFAYNVIETDEDDDGQQGEGSNPISEDQAQILRDRCKEYDFTDDDKRRVLAFAGKLQELEFLKSFSLVRKCDYAAVLVLVDEMGKK